MRQYIKLWQNLDIVAGTTTKYYNQQCKKGEISALLKIQTKQAVYAEQIHGSKIKIVTEKHRGMIIKGVDGLITKAENLYLIIKTADCVPLFFYDPLIEIVGIAHAGWRGSYTNIATKMINTLVNLGASPKNIKVHLGPHIKVECYEIDNLLAKKFIKKFNNQSIVSFTKGRKYLDLSGVNKLQLEREGILAKNISISPHCTFCEQSLYFSYRRDVTKRHKDREMISFIAKI